MLRTSRLRSRQGVLPLWRGLATIGALVLLHTVLGAAPLHAQPGLRALDAAWLTPRPTSPATGLSLAAHVGYGVSGAVAGTQGPHHRTMAALALGLTLPRGFGLELRADGRWDIHDVPGGDDGLIGEPRLYARYAHALGERLQLGLEAGVWVPGGTAPSLQFRATTLDALALGELALGSRVSLLAALGPRLDRSAQSVDPELVLSRSDKLALGVSSYHALLWRVALETRLGAARLAAELSADTLLGDGAPRLVESPLRAALIARRAFGERFEGVTWISLLLSARPTQREADYVPFEPRFGCFLGARYRYERGARAAPTPHAAPPAAAQSPPAGEQPVAAHAALRVRVFDQEGQPLPDVRVVLAGIDELRTGGSGSVRFTDLRAGQRELIVMGEGFITRTLPLALGPGDEAEADVVLQPEAARSAVRILVRDAETGATLHAELSLTALGRGRGSAPEVPPAQQDGSFAQSLAPGRYRLLVRAAGYQRQQRVVEVKERGVTVFNVDLSPERR
jgi:hypothetical protein